MDENAGVTAGKTVPSISLERGGAVMRTGGQLMRAFRALRGVGVLAALLGAWQLVGRAGSVDFPPPSMWLRAGESLLRREDVLGAVGRTASLFVAGLAVVIVIGTFVGVIVGGSPRVDRALGPTLNFLRVTPAPVVVPFAALLLGYSFLMSVVVVVLGTVWPVLLEVRAGRRAMGSMLTDVAGTLGLSPLATFRKILVPGVLGSVINGATVAAPLCLIISIVVGMIAALPGLGGLILSAQENFDSAEVYALVVIAGFLALIVNVVVRLGDRLLARRTGR